MTELDVFQCISHPIRREIVQILAKQNMSIVAIKKYIDQIYGSNDSDQKEKLSRTAITKHLTVLLKAGLVEKQNIGRETIFQLKIDPLIEIKDWLSYIDKYWDEKLNTLKILLESDKK